MSKLILSYEYDASFFNKAIPNDDFGWLELRLEVDRFAGAAGFWVQWQDVVEFGQELPVSPARLNGPLFVQWGFDAQKGDDLILRMGVAPEGSLGEIKASVEIADQHAPENRVRASFRTTYAAMDLFKRDIERLMARDIDKAELLGH